MDFKKVTDDLFVRIDHDDLAKALGVSVASIRQARLRTDAKAHRGAPPGWEKAILRLAEKQAIHFQRLVTTMKKGDF